MTEHNLPEPDDAPWLNLTPQEVEELRYNKQNLTNYGREKIRALMEEKKLLKECRQTGRTTATTEKVLKTVFSQMTEKTNEPSGWNPVFEFPLDDRNTIIIDGVKYKRVEEPKPKKLFDVIRNLGYSVDMCYEIVDAVRCWLPDEHCNITDYDLGWNDVLRKIKDGLG
jgi:hypothetical protein